MGSAHGGTVTVWFLRCGIDEPELSESHLAALAPEERDRAARFRFVKDRRLYVASRVLLRNLLSQHADVAPTAWGFVADEYGKPRVTHPAGTALEITLSHTNGLVCCAVSPGLAIGVDAEDISRTVDMEAVAERCFSPAERLHLESGRAADQRLEFFKYWTLKEALVKALGVGFSADTSAISFHVRGEAIDVCFQRRFPNTTEWYFRLFRPTSDHILAVCVAQAGPVAAKIHVSEVFLTPNGSVQQHDDAA